MLLFPLFEYLSLFIFEFLELSPFSSSILFPLNSFSIGFDKITSSIRSMIPWHNIEECFVSIEEIYNKNIRKRVYIFTEYRKMVEDMSAGMAERLRRMDQVELEVI